MFDSHMLLLLLTLFSIIRAGESSRLPKSPPGFIVAKSRKVSAAVTTCVRNVLGWLRPGWLKIVSNVC